MLYKNILNRDWSKGDGEPDGACTSLHQTSQTPPRATHYFRGQTRWVCGACAQHINRTLLLERWLTDNNRCVTGAQHTFELLKA